MFPPNFIIKYWKLQKLWSFYEKYQNFKLTKLTQRKKVFFKFLFFIQINQAYKTGIWLRNIKPTYRSQKINRTENRARKAIWNDFPQESIKKAVVVFRKRLQACIRAQKEFKCRFLPFQAWLIWNFDIFCKKFITFEVFNILQ